MWNVTWGIIAHFRFFHQDQWILTKSHRFSPQKNPTSGFEKLTWRMFHKKTPPKDDDRPFDGFFFPKETAATRNCRKTRAKLIFTKNNTSFLNRLGFSSAKKSLVVGSGSGWLWIAHWQGGWWLDFFDGKWKLRGDPKGPKGRMTTRFFSQPIMACFRGVLDRVCRIKKWNLEVVVTSSRAEIQKDSRSRRFFTPF